MDHDEAMEHDTHIGVNQAHEELGKHRCEGFVMSGEFYARNVDDVLDYERICIVVGGMLQSRRILLWLGY